MRLTMTGDDLRRARTSLGISQVEAAARLGVSQTLLSLMEKGARSVTEAVAENAVKALATGPELLPAAPDERHDNDELAADLGTLGYPGYRHLRGRLRNPGEVILDAIDRPDLDARLVEALPWIPLHYPKIDWDWLTAQAKIRNRQNRLGFIVALAAKLAKGQSTRDVARQLDQVEKTLEDARLAKADTLCQESWPPAQRRFARQRRTALAAHWKLDTRLSEVDLAYAAT